MGSFNLTGIAPAPRGIPQIEVTFDVDANGIVHVSAKDLGTGKATDITITSSTNLSEADIDKAVKEAEQYEAEDKKRKEEVEAKNQLDSMIFTFEKTLKDNADKLSDEDKATIENAVKEAKTELESGDAERIKKATEELSNKGQAVFAKLYQQQQAAGNANAGSDGGANDDDTEFHQN